MQRLAGSADQTKAQASETATANSVALALLTDMQCNSANTEKKENLVPILPQICDKLRLPRKQFWLLDGGDTIEGKLPTGECSSCIPCLHCCIKDGASQTKAYRKLVFDPVKKYKMSYAIIPGNHNFYVPTHESLELIVDQYGTGNPTKDPAYTPNPGNLYFMKQLGPLFYLVCCAVYPDEKIRKWVRKEHDRIHADAHEQVNYAFLQHFNLGCLNNKLGEHDAWYSQEEEDAQAELTNDLEKVGGSVVAILTGHNHSTYHARWTNQHLARQDIPVYCGGGKELPVLLFDINGTPQQSLCYQAKKSGSGFVPEEIPMPEWDDTMNTGDTFSEKMERAWNTVVVTKQQHMYDKD
jgi:hypothetical protein